MIHVGTSQSIAGQFVAAILAKDYKAALYCAEVHVEAGLSVFYDQLVAPALVELDALWRQHRITLTAQQLATGIIELALARSYTVASWPTSGPTFVIACAPGEHHSLGARMLSDLMAASGWSELFLGGGTSADAMARAAKENNARAIGLSITLSSNLPAAHRCIVRLRRAVPGIRVLVGGLACARLADPVSALDADGYAECARDAIEVADAWRQ